VDKRLDGAATLLMERLWEDELQGDSARVEALFLKMLEGSLSGAILLWWVRGWASTCLRGKSLRDFATASGLSNEQLLSCFDAIELFGDRLQRLQVSAVSGGVSEALQPCKPLRERIGLGARRHERGEWKTLLSAPTTLHEQGRDSELDLKILRGDITADVRVYVLQQDKRIVSFLLSSTFTDTEWERNLLIDDVVPYLQDYARKHGFEFRLAEMRW
jgi:hypothetical protein